VVVNAVSVVIANVDSMLGSAGKYGSAFGLNVLICTGTDFIDAISALFSK
jgi:hypothetical protein